MKYTENIGLPIVEDNDLYSKEINNLAFEEIDKNIEALAERVDLIDNPETGIGNILEIMVRKEDIAQDLDAPEREKVLSTEALANILDKKTEEIETLIEDTDNATRLDLTNEILSNKVADVALNDSDELIVTYGDGTELNVGVVGTGGAGTSSVNKIEVDSNTDEEYVLKITTDGTDFLTPNLKGVGDNIFVGIDVDGETGNIIVDVAGSHIGDIYINSNNGNLYVRDDANNSNNHWTYKGNIRGIQGKSNYDLAVKNGFKGTEQDYLDSLVAENIEALIVANKPVLADPSTKLKTWYFYQVDGDTDNSAWKYKMVLPSVADYPAGDYCVYYDLKPYCGTFTANSPALTNKDKYKYYAIMDLQAVTTEVIREELNTGNTVVLETIQCTQEEPTTHTVINAPMESLGKWVQTLYLGATKETASEVTLSTGTSVSGFVTSKAFEETVGNRNNLKTLDKTSIVNAINEHEELLRENTTVLLNTKSKNVIGAINELNAKSHLDVFDLVGGNVLDYALTTNALTYTCFYANNCDGLPNNERYGYCYVEVSQDPLYRDLIFDSPTTGRRWSITIGSEPDNPAIQGEWSEWHEELLREDIASVLDDTVTDEQVASAKSVYDRLKNINDFSVQVVKENLDLNNITKTGIYFFPQAYTPVNIPVGANGWLVVMKGSSSDIVKQIWYRQGMVSLNSYNTFERYKSGNTWSEWTKFLTEKEYYNALNYGNPVIPQDSDLNDYLTPGVYTCMSSEIASKLVNCPHIGSNFKLIVNKNRGNNNTFYGYQMIVGTKGGNPVTDVCVYYRGISMYDNVCVFSKWKIMSGSTVADVVNVDVTQSLVTTKATAENIIYEVKNGWCIVKLNSIKPLISGSKITILPDGTLPKSNGYLYNNLSNWNVTSSQNILVRVGVKGELTMWCASGNENIAYVGSFSYPVAEE